MQNTVYWPTQTLSSLWQTSLLAFGKEWLFPQHLHLKFGLGCCSGLCTTVSSGYISGEGVCFGCFISLDGFPSEYFTARIDDTELHTIHASLHINSLNSLKPG